MEKLVLFIISGPLFLNLWFGEQNKNWVADNFSPTDTIPHKENTEIVKKCIDCHGSLVEKQNKHITKTDKGCEDCHKSNGNEHPKDKTIGFSKQNNLPDLCFSCHEEKKELISSAQFVHQPVKDKKSCTNCHSPHSSDIKKLLITNRKELCLGCHNKTITGNSKSISNIDKLMKTSKVKHPPFEDCEKVCHNPHASQDYRLLNIAFPVGNYLKVNVDSFALCWECHETGLIQKAQTTKATNFRDGDRNLHFIHVHGEKGRSCIMCHSPHATNNEHLIREKVGFGNWEFNMNYSSSEKGGSCSPGCHAEKKYTR